MIKRVYAGVVAVVALGMGAFMWYVVIHMLVGFWQGVFTVLFLPVTVFFLTLSWFVLTYAAMKPNERKRRA